MENLTCKILLCGSRNRFIGFPLHRLNETFPRHTFLTMEPTEDFTLMSLELVSGWISL